MSRGLKYMSDNQTYITEIKNIIKKFVDDREWDKFHSPKNLSMSVAIEAAELMELFQWLSFDESKKMMQNGKLRDDAIDEIADILIYAISFCNRNNIDISDAINQKMKKNEKKYPADEFRGKF